MKSLVEFLTEVKLFIDESTNIPNPFKGLDMSDQKWPRHGITDEKLKICKETVKKWAWEYYGKKYGEKNYDFAILEDTYMMYLEQDNNCTTSEKEKDYKNLVRMLKSPYGSFNMNTPQSWWYFVYCAIKKLEE